MTIESRREKLIFYGLVPVCAAAVGAMITSFMQGHSCLPQGGLDLAAIIKDSSMNGSEKLKALEIYKEVTSRPWAALNSFLVIVSITGTAIAWAVADWIRKK